MVKISESDCLLEKTRAGGALASATGRDDDGEVSLRLSSSSCFSFILMIGYEKLWSRCRRILV